MTTPPIEARRLRWWRQRWFTIVLGFLLSFAIGMGYASYLKSRGDWHVGASWERRAMLGMQMQLPHWVDVLILQLPWFGTNLTLIPLTIIGVIWLVRRYKRYRDAIRLVVVQIGAYLLNPSLKFLYDRQRPDLFPKRGWYGWAAYPSGHAIAGVAVLFTYAIIVHRVTGWRWPFYLVGVLCVLSLVSRVYLGVHWPTDIIGGALIGLAWLAVTHYAFHDRRG